jgi:hypothetical protein
MPSGLGDILKVLHSCEKPGRSKIAAYLLDISGEWRERMFNTLTNELERADGQRPRPFSTFGEVRLTNFTWTPLWPRFSENEIHDHVKAIIVMNDEPDRILLEVSYDDKGVIVDVSWQEFKSTDISADDLPGLVARGRALRESRLQKALAAGKIGRNEMCPCGSGIKFKKCCASEINRN